MRCASRQAIVVTDFDVHAQWVCSRLAYYFVALDETRAHLEELGIRANRITVSGLEESQQVFGGVEQQGDRLGAAGAPVAIQLFTDMQCSNCRSQFLSTVPPLVQGDVRDGKLTFNGKVIAIPGVKDGNIDDIHFNVRPGPVRAQ